MGGGRHSSPQHCYRSGDSGDSNVPGMLSALCSFLHTEVRSYGVFRLWCPRCWPGPCMPMPTPGAAILSLTVTHNISPESNETEVLQHTPGRQGRYHLGKCSLWLCLCNNKRVYVCLCPKNVFLFNKLPAERPESRHSQGGLVDSAFLKTNNN